MLFKEEISKYIENLSLISDKLPELVTEYDIEIEVDGYWSASRLPDFNLNFSFEVNYEYEFLDNYTWINFVYDYKKEDLVSFLINVKNNKFAAFSNDSSEIKEHHYYSNYPHILFAIPIEDNIRFIVAQSFDYVTFDGERILMDILVKKDMFVSAFEKAIGELEVLNVECKQENNQNNDQENNERST